MEDNYNNQDDRYRYYSSQPDDSRQSYGTSGYRYQPDTGRYESDGEQEMGVGKWLLTFLICIIPVVNIIMLIVWAVGSNPKNQIRKNWARAKLVWAVIMTVLSVIFSVILWHIAYAVFYSIAADGDTVQQIWSLWDGNYDSDAVTLPDTAEERAVVDATPTEGDWQDLAFEFDNHYYTLPFAYEELAANGWTLDDSDYDAKQGYVLNPKDTSYSYLVTNSAYEDVTVFISFYNPSDEIKDITECEVYRFYYDSGRSYYEDDPTHYYPNMNVDMGPCIGMDKDTVLSYMGKCEDVYKASGYSSYYYNSEDYSKSVDFDLYKKYGITSISLTAYPD